MATLFPFNQTAKLPGIVINQITPIVTKQLEKFNSITSKIEQRLESFSKNVKCNDAEILDLKNKLNQLKTILDNLNRIQQQLQPLVNRLQLVSRTANTIGGILLAIPAVVGVPEGPKAQTIQTIADLVAGIISVLNVLNILLKIINKVVPKALNIINRAEQSINSLCKDNNASGNNTIASTSAPQANDINDTELSANVLSINGEYPTQFYQTVNVSNSDIKQRVDSINNLIEDELNVLTNLKEAPSKIFYNAGIPASDLGFVGDYYIDTNTQTVYGPKPTINSWN